MKKDRVISFDFIRCFATICIVIFHFMLNGRHIYPDDIFFKNYDLAQVGVSLFFILSGATLYFNNNSDFKLKDYYKKRWLAIFPMFYIAYVVIFLTLFWKEGHIPSGVPYQNIIFSLIGMDGILSYKFPVFCMTGEWFLGAIIILYIIYPFVRLLVKKIPKTSFVLFFFFYIILINNYIWKMPMLFSPFVRGIEFIFGMVYVELYNSYTKNWSKQFSWSCFVLGTILSILMLYVELPLPQMLEISIGGCAIFTVMMEIGKTIKNTFITIFIKFISKYSFSIFLVHHYIANIVSFHFGNLDKIEMLLATIIYFSLTLLFAVLLFKVTTMLVYKVSLLSKKHNYKSIKNQ